ncbi:glutamine synthetase III [Adlercreutzia muris]|uniref:Glutamine synthetase type III n=1 Tax=Adlercreutzia muris TaxID=1796610 RepID=A0A7C8BS52_9ACTN|nr:glutamine synthetase III [Adlercreutzia muris]KAB1651295.1 glutamine synthetase type III [Adlercreutzia muris]MCR2027564.1 glutamine synthetase III [Adlercreutzia muris]MCU7583886.1 glutamine synthetase III [Adlercreutzia muris]TGY74858.1 glutamine synthetase type III [Enterorhabdus sp. NM05_H27]
MSKVTDIYGSMVFNEHTMQERLPSATYKQLMRTIKGGEPLDIDVANVVAHAMKEWAIEKGATHFTHWFQPLTGITSEKHDSFIDPTPDGRAIMTFSGKELIQGEPDASSFPSGGLRATFEARGYTAWDPTSYAFIKDEVLCIPTAFCSYTGEALDKKTPLLRSMKAIEIQAKRVLALFGEAGERVTTTLGAEQEYFLVSERDYEQRLDLMLTGRTLFGYSPCKGQELEEHYFGAIRPTVNEFMKELDDELWALGVSARTKHNEVAPAQHELAPIFAETNRGVDENLLTMEKMKLLASHYGLVCLQHEKPFEFINGSGKHNNWSISADGKNLFDPGENPMENLRFLVFLTCVIEAVDEYQELLRMSAASAGNDHRLGANEAPPAIVSMFLGDELGAIVEALVDEHDYTSAERVSMDLGVDVLPNFIKDNTDRNRTSPFAFTGNKFEFRMPGSAQNLSDVNMVLNTAMAKSLKGFADAMEGKTGDAFEAAAIDYIKRTLRDHERIIFNGDGYSAEWEAEAARRGLANHRTTAEALPCYVSPKSIALFAEFGVLTETEVRSRYEVKLEKYNKIMNIECRVMKRLVRRDYLPAINRYAAKLANGIAAIRGVLPDGDTSFMEDKLRKLVAGAAEINRQLEKLNDLHHASREIADQQERANMNAHEIVPVMNALREAVDSLEIIVEREAWPVPTYNEILFYA